MKYFKKLFLLVLLISAMDSFGQANEKVEMADILREDGKIYTVVFGVVIILTAMIILLIRVDRNIFRVEKSLKEK